MMVDGRTSFLMFFRQAFASPVAVVHYMVHLPIVGAQTASERWTSFERLLADNQSLRNQNLLLSAELQRFLVLQSENTYLKALLKSSQTVKAKVLIADVLAVDTEPFIHQVVLNKGKRDGLYLGQPVLDATGV
ncbi:MAG TPA: rod shape-determining protein MreC, partial [Myxococcota bacterium]|nr:rod shape-determining protein MreC [Myxococcota bacterium]